MASDSKLNCTCWQDWHRCYKDASPTLNTIRRAFTSLLRWAYSDPSKMADFGDALGCYTYNNEPGANNIITIASDTAAHPGETELFPGIYVSLGEGVSFQSPSMQPYLNESPDTSTTELATIASTNITIRCLDKDPSICCLMADLCAMFLFAMTERLFNTWSWLRIYSLQNQTEPTKKTGEGNDDTHWYESTLTFKMEYEYRVFTARESKRLKDFSLESTPMDTYPSIR